METTEVDPRAALEEDSEEGNRIDEPEPVAPEEEESGEEDVLDTLVPKAEQKEWTLRDERGDEVIERTYVQKPLSYFQKMEFFALVGEVIDKAVSGEDGMRMSQVFGSDNSLMGIANASQLQDIDTFIQAAGKLMVHAPDLLKKSYCIWWSVPQYERPWAMEVMEMPEDEGGLSDDEGIEAIEIFIDQNWSALDGFFREKLAGLRDRVQTRRKENESQRSKHSKDTPLPTENQ